MSNPDDDNDDDDDAKKKSGSKTIAEKLLEIAQETTFFTATDGKAYVQFKTGNHRELWPVKSQGFRNWLKLAYRKKFNKPAMPDAVKTAVEYVEAEALHSGEEREIFLRIGSYRDKIYVDLCDKEWRCVEISHEGWRICPDAPVLFRRTPAMMALPAPQRGVQGLKRLRKLLNLHGKAKDAAWVLIVSWLLAALRPTGPYPILVFHGEQGSAKSFISRLLKLLCDPNAAPLRALPSNDRDLFIGAVNSYCMAFDNVSKVLPWQSDALCKLSTGGGYVCRSLFTNDTETVLSAQRPTILNGIGDFVSRADAADRAIIVHLDHIDEANRKTEKKVMADFSAARPFILSDLFDAVAEGLSRIDTVALDGLPRMADFALWATACETKYFNDGDFMKAFAANREEAVDVVIENDIVGAGVLAIMEETESWDGTATKLLTKLTSNVSEAETKSPDFPKNGKSVGNRLDRIVPFLRKKGVEIERYRATDKARTRYIRITRSPEPTTFASDASDASDSSLYANGSGGSDDVQL